MKVLSDKAAVYI